jgi:hypothetical protein
MSAISPLAQDDDRAQRLVAVAQRVAHRVQRAGVRTLLAERLALTLAPAARTNR